jgi:myosin-crossreactive antigen
MKLQLAAVVCGVMLAGSAMAIEGISIGGDANQSVTAASVTNAATGGDADQAVAAVTGDVAIGGNLDQHIAVDGAISNAATGGDASQKVGVIQSK